RRLSVAQRTNGFCAVELGRSLSVLVLCFLLVEVWAISTGDRTGITTDQSAPRQAYKHGGASPDLTVAPPGLRCVCEQFRFSAVSVLHVSRPDISGSFSRGGIFLVHLSPACLNRP